jgi:hypothetical protein
MAMLGTPGLVAVVASYVVVAGLLLSLNVLSLWRWWVKAGAIGVTTAFYAGSYVAINAMLGWPATNALPERFEVLSTRIVEPDDARDEDGALYLWIEELDENNVPLARPRAFALPYDDRLAEEVAEVQEQLDAGEEIMGVVQEDDAELEPADGDLRIGEIPEGVELTTNNDTVPFRLEGLNVEFEELPPVLLPPKSPL